MEENIHAQQALEAQKQLLNDEQIHFQKVYSEIQVSNITVKTMEPKFFSFLNQQKCQDSSIKAQLSTSREAKNSQIFLKDRRVRQKQFVIPTLELCRKIKNIQNTLKRTKKFSHLKYGHRSQEDKGRITKSDETMRKKETKKAKIVQFNKIDDGTKESVVKQALNGQGRLKLDCGKEFEGVWVNGNLSSHGKIYYPNGDVYEGDIREYKKHGVGKLVLNDGRKYIGQFSNGNISGYGKFLNSEDNLIAEGLFSQGILITSKQFKEYSKNNKNIPTSDQYSKYQ